MRGIRSPLAVCVLALACVTSAACAQTDSFESYTLGAIDNVSDERQGPLGSWSADGSAEITHRRASTGAQALRIFGGEAQQVTLELAEPHAPGLVRFKAERWTQRSPFAFTVEARIGDTWETVYEDDGSQIVIGGYYASVECRVDDPFDALRLTCSSPEGGGILIDDFMLDTLRPMRIVSVTTEQPVLPVLIGNSINPIARIRVVTEGTVSPITIDSVRWTLSSSESLADLAAVTAYMGTTDALTWRNPNECFDPEDMMGSPVLPSPSIETAGSTMLTRGENYLWLSVALTDHANLDGWIDAGCEAVTFSNGETLTPEVTHPDPVQRLGVAVRNSGDDGVAAYRIPGIITTNHGTLIAVYDIRYRGWGDLPGDIDVGMSRSIDGGTTWEPMRTVMDTGSDPEWNHDGVGDPGILYDPATDTVWVAATWSHGNRSWNGSGPGLTPEQTGQLLLSKSTDDGKNWSDPINITEQVKDPAWAFVLASPGEGMVMSDGTLVFPAQFQLSPDEGRTPHSTVMYSKDHGESWSIGTGAKPNTTESRVVELEPGTLMLNMRDNRRGSRAVHVSRDLGQTWAIHPSSRGALPEPTCNAGMIRVRDGADPRHPWLAFVNPNVSTGPRRHMTLKLSTDGGMTWPAAHHLLLDQGISAGYPSLTMIDGDTLGVFYEGSRANMTFQRIPLADLLHHD